MIRKIPKVWKLPAISKLPAIWDRVMHPPARTPAAERRLGIVITAIDDFESLEFPWVPAPTPIAPRARLRTVALAGNLLVLCFVLGFGIWASVAPLDSAAVAPGVVEPESSRKTIQHLEGGIVSRILVSDGDVVRSGQTLIALDDTRAASEVQSLQGQLWDAMARSARLQAEQQGQDSITVPSALAQDGTRDAAAAAAMSAQQTIFQARGLVHQSQLAVIRERRLEVEKEIEGLKAQESAIAQRIGIVREELDMVTTLVNKGLERRPRLLNLQRELAEVEGRRGEIAAQVARAAQVINEAQATLFKLESDRQNEIAQSLRETQSQIFQLREKLLAARDQLSRTEVKAPEDGVITDLRIHTPGGVVGAGAPLMDLVPRQDRLIVTARLRPEDIDVVHPGLKAEVLLIPYNQRRVPRLKGTVVHVSADRLLDKRTDQPYYATKIRIDDVQSDAGDVHIIAGMPAQVFITTGRGTVALYALRPLLDSFRNAFRED
jgi:HlyD family secretion protein